MGYIQAIYRRGVFEPLEPVDLHEEEHVRLSVEPSSAKSSQAWLAQVRAIHAQVRGRRGPLPDSTSEIAMDRLR